jgi:hypothetical protein
MERLVGLKGVKRKAQKIEWMKQESEVTARFCQGRFMLLEQKARIANCLQQFQFDAGVGKREYDVLPFLRLGLFTGIGGSGAEALLLVVLTVRGASTSDVDLALS